MNTAAVRDAGTIASRQRANSPGQPDGHCTNSARNRSVSYIPYPGLSGYIQFLSFERNVFARELRTIDSPVSVHYRPVFRQIHVHHSTGNVKIAPGIDSLRVRQIPLKMIAMVLATGIELPASAIECLRCSILIYLRHIPVC